MKRLVLIAVMTVGCAGSPSAPSSSDLEIEALRHDRYVLLDSPTGPASPSPAERDRLELEWPPVDQLSLPGPSVRRVKSSPRASEPGLPACTARVRKGKPCRGDAPTPEASPQREGAVMLRVESNGYGVPALELTTR